MNSGTSLLVLLISWLTFMVGMSNAYAAGSALGRVKSCGHLLTEAKEQVAFTLLRRLINHSVVSKEDAPEIKDWITKTEELTEAYLNYAEISYEKSAKHAKIQWGDQIITHMVTPIYRITGGSEIDSNGRLFHGFFLKSKDPHVRVAYDPIYRFVVRPQGKAAGDFNEATNAITFSTRGFWDKDLNFDNVLRHEMHHYFEQKKLEGGEFTLARFTLQQKNADTKEPYANYARLDELETHLRDLRSLREIGEQKSQFYLEIPVLPTTLAEYEAMRIRARASKLKNIETIAQRSLAAFAEVRQKLKLIGYQRQPGGQMDTFLILRNGHYGIFELSLPAQDKIGYNDLAVQAKILENLEMAEKRIEQILKEARQLPK